MIKHENILLTHAKANLLESVLQLLGDPSVNTQPNAETFETFQDLDLIVLGADGVDYRQYIEQIRKEYPHMDDASYNTMRSRVTKRLPISDCDCICGKRTFSYSLSRYWKHF